MIPGMYKCDAFNFTNSVTQIVGLYIGDEIYLLTNIQEAVATSQTHSGLNKVKASALRRRLSNQRLIASEQTTRFTGGCDLWLIDVFEL